MAESLFEPKRVPKYTENIIKPGTGLQSAPVPVRQRSVSTGTPKLAQAQNPAPAPAVTVTTPPVVTATPPQAPGETRAFSFDGATELTGSLGTTFGSNVQMGLFYMQGTFTPGWGQSDTGSYNVFSIATPGTDVDRYDVYFTRAALGSGYRDYLEVRRLSGSSWRSSNMRVSADGNFYSGSMEEVYIEAKLVLNGVSQLHVNGKAAPSLYGPDQNNQSGLDYFKTIPSSSLAFSLGGMNSGSDNYYTGSISNFALFKANALTSRKTIADLTNDTTVKMYYKFEGNTTATKGFDLDVVGTETYVSSSI